MEGENKSSLLLNFLFFREIILVGLIFFFSIFNLFFGKGVDELKRSWIRTFFSNMNRDKLLF